MSHAPDLAELKQPIGAHCRYEIHVFVFVAEQLGAVRDVKRGA